MSSSTENQSAAAIAPATTSSSPSATTTTTTTPIPATSKLQPAPAPLVSAWGNKKSSAPSAATPVAPVPAAATKAPQNGQQWPSAEAALEPSVSKDTIKEPQMNPSKTTTAAIPKVKSTGKEKWLPFAADIILPSPSNNNNNKKKNNNNSNNNKKKQNQGNKQQQNNKGGKGKKTTNGDSNNKSQAKSNNGDKNSDVTKGVEDLKLDSKAPKKKEAANESPALVDPLEESAKSEQLEPGLKSTDSTTTQPETSDKSTASTTPLTPHQLTQPQLQQQQFQGAQQQNFNNNNNNKKKFQHRNSEPYNNGQPFQQNYNNNHKGGRRYNPNNKNNYNNNYRHSIAVTGAYGNLPFIPNYNTFGYPPVFTANGLSYPNIAYQQQQVIPRSQSGSPAKDEFIPQINNGIPPIVGAPNVPGVAPIYAPAVNYNIYGEDSIAMIAKQLKYYFSGENLCKDLYLRRQMNSKGFVPLATLFSFQRVNILSGNDINQLYAAIPMMSDELEFVNDKVRVRKDWKNWVFPVEKRDAAGKVEEKENEEEEEDDEVTPEAASTNA